ncbi:MAG: hypothetical protein AB7J32_19055 [Pseudonocardia sp.]
MAALSDRWSREAARARWQELRAFDGTVVGVGIPLMALWPLAALVLSWNVYANPWAASAVYIASVALPLAMWRRGPGGITLAASLSSIAAALALAVLLAAQIDPGEVARSALTFWPNSWASATFFVLAFARPPEEPLLGFAGLTAINYAVYLPPGADLFIRQNAPGRVGAVVPAAVAILAMIGALRIGVRNVARNRALAVAAEQQLAMADAVTRERAERFESWESSVAPLLEDLASGRRDVTDPELCSRCRQLEAQLRDQLSAVADSLFAVLLRSAADELRTRGGKLVISDVDVGFQLRELDRLMLVDLVAAVVAQPGTATVGLTLLGEPDSASALVMVAVTGVPVPDGPAWTAAAQRRDATLSLDDSRRWFWDVQLPLDPAPALPHDDVAAG